MARDEVITGLDLGSTNIRVVVGKPTADGQIQVLGAADHPSEGISKGAVTSIEEAVSSISSCLEKAERMTGIPVEHAYVGINGNHISSQESHGVVAVAKADGEIREEDVERVLEAAQAVSTPPNYEILHVVPRSFTVDNQKGIRDPIGMTGIRIEVDAQIIQGLTAQIKNLTKCVYRTGVDINDLVLGPLAAAEAVVSKRQKELGVALVNIGASTTGLIVFEEGDVLHASILPVGAGHVTNDIAIGLRTSIDIAERIKVEFGSCVPDEVNKREEINLEEFGRGESGVVSRRHIAEIIEARIEEIFKLVDRELQKIDRSGLLPAGIILTGGGAKLDGILDVAKREFRLPASIGTPHGLLTAIDRVNDAEFTTAVGLLMWGDSLVVKEGSRAPLASRFSAVSEVTGRMKKWFKSFIP